MTVTFSGSIIKEDSVGESMDQENKNIFVLEVDMDNREPVDIARDAANQIAALFDRLVEKKIIRKV